MNIESVRQPAQNFVSTIIVSLIQKIIVYFSWMLVEKSTVTVYTIFESIECTHCILMRQCVNQGNATGGSYFRKGKK